MSQNYIFIYCVWKYKLQANNSFKFMHLLNNVKLQTKPLENLYINNLETVLVS